MKQARYSKYLVIWTDCDREGEHIGTEVRDQAKKGNARIIVKRARFNNTERAYVDRGLMFENIANQGKATFSMLQRN